VAVYMVTYGICVEAKKWRPNITFKNSTLCTAKYGFIFWRGSFTYRYMRQAPRVPFLPHMRDLRRRPPSTRRFLQKQAIYLFI